MCNSCEILSINGVLCHELGCPEAWKDEVRECKWCGEKFKPERDYQDCCSHSCEVAYHNLDCCCEECFTEDEIEVLSEMEVKE